MLFSHGESHRVERIGWLRATVLGANDGIISVSSLLIGVAAAHSTHSDVLVAGTAAIIAGAMSMAAGEYISVSSQADTELAEIQRETHELKSDFPAELEELTAIYVKRGLERSLAAEVAKQLMAQDSLGAHVRDELGITSELSARPLQAAVFSAFSFTLGAILPMLVAMLSPVDHTIPAVFMMSIIFLALLGALAAKVGGSGVLKGAVRVTIWGTLAMLVTAAIGSVLGAAV
jgi:VIT1/CCC1 family predicted Fe2+/Mn2+ transporter